MSPMVNQSYEVVIESDGEIKEERINVNVRINGNCYGPFVLNCGKVLQAIRRHERMYVVESKGRDNHMSPLYWDVRSLTRPNSQAQPDDAVKRDQRVEWRRQQFRYCKLLKKSDPLSEEFHRFKISQVRHSGQTRPAKSSQVKSGQASSSKLSLIKPFASGQVTRNHVKSC